MELSASSQEKFEKHWPNFFQVCLNNLYESVICNSCKLSFLDTGFVRVLENLESPGILLWHFPGLESPGKRPLVLESSGNLLNSAKKYEVYERQ